MTITDQQRPMPKKSAQMMRSEGVRVEADLRNEKIGFKITRGPKSENPIYDCHWR